ncbi:hypothetical protein J5N97_015191 [Dioscorea zingiberensis]|uniref:Flavin-containing monooxygenase n=1 Tax=Dioscorea zingiberensis TaxID=325984 RepID=A0A9D5CVD5_9LILI|nr:hypothetical protein J5N97_015191 [Dioscorea zingiberensis]
MEATVVIVGAGSAGLATAACLTTHSIPYVLLERDDCIGSLWRKRSYDRVKLHITKQYCQLPHAPHPPETPTFMPKKHFIEYLEGYADRFGIRPLLKREVESAWFLVVASGENDAAVVPEMEGLEGFNGDVVHSSRYRSGSDYKGKSVLVVGSGNSGMEIAYDLSCSGAVPSIVVRSPANIVSKEIWALGNFLLGFLPISLVDDVVLFLCYLKYGNTSKYGIARPTKGPFHLLANSYPILDCGTFDKIKSGEIQVLPSIARIEGNKVRFANGKTHHFDAIIFATGYRSAVKKWLKGADFLIGDDGMAKQKWPNHWKGVNGLYCAGLGRRGIYGGGVDAINIANDINSILHPQGTNDTLYNNLHA